MHALTEVISLMAHEDSPLTQRPASHILIV